MHSELFAKLRIAWSLTKILLWNEIIVTEYIRVGIYTEGFLPLWLIQNYYAGFDVLFYVIFLAWFLGYSEVGEANDIQIWKA